MIYVMVICIGMTWGMCHSIVRQEYPTMAACLADRDYQRKENYDVKWIKCEKYIPPSK